MQFFKPILLSTNTLKEASFKASRLRGNFVTQLRNTHSNEGPSSLPNPPMLSQLTTEQESEEARAWVTRFTASKAVIPKEAVELTFSRSSGPGGQNVNKVNTKATLRCPVNAAWIPRWALPDLIKNPHYVASTHSILITSTVHRSQAQNIAECLQKLHSLVLSAASKSIKSTPSQAQQKKVSGLIKAENARRKTDKMRRSSVKQNRSGKGGLFGF